MYGSELRYTGATVRLDLFHRHSSRPCSRNLTMLAEQTTFEKAIKSLVKGPY